MPDSQQQLIKQLLKTIDGAVTSFSKSVPAFQRQIFDDVTLLIKDLDVSSEGNIKNSVTNLRIIGKIKSKLDAIVLSSEYLKEVKEFIKTFDAVAKIQNQYFKTIEKSFKPTKLLAEIQNQSIGATITSLTEAGIDYNITESIKAILNTNITEGGSYSDLLKQLRQSIISKPGQGLLERYMSKTVIDSIQQFNAQYAHAISDDLNLQWYWYYGTLIETSRCFCRALVKRKYIHKSELQKIVDGDFEEFQEMKCDIYPKTGLPQGMIDGTNASNFKIRRGGHRCGHQLGAVSSAVVPMNIRMKFEYLSTSLHQEKEVRLFQ